MLEGLYLGSVAFQFTMKMGDTLWGLVWVPLDEENSLGALPPPLAILWVSFGGLEDIGGGVGAPGLALRA